jgi:hypothetical protein
MERDARKTLLAKRLDDGFVVLSDETQDSDGDIIRQAGWDFARAPGMEIPMTLAHDKSTFPLGKWTLKLDAEGRQLLGKPTFAAEEDPARAGVAAKLWDGGFINATSVGFRIPEGAEVKNMPNGWGREYIRGHQVYEAAICIAGANPNARKALESAVEKGIITAEEKAVMDGDEPMTRSEFRAWADGFAERMEKAITKAAAVAAPGDPAPAAKGPAASKQEPPADDKGAMRDVLARVAKMIDDLEERKAKQITEAVQAVVTYHLGRLD